MDFLAGLSGPILYIVIFLAKIIEVTISTIRLVYINKGEKIKGTMLAFIEISIWLVVVSSVLTNIAADPMKALVYAVAFSLGNYIGITIESKIAVGLVSIQAVVNEESGQILADVLREQGFGVTIMDGKGKNDSKKNLLFIQLKRKRITEAIAIIKESAPNSYISVNDIKSMTGGFVKK